MGGHVATRSRATCGSRPTGTHGHWRTRRPRGATRHAAAPTATSSWRTKCTLNSSVSTKNGDGPDALTRRPRRACRPGSAARSDRSCHRPSRGSLTQTGPARGLGRLLDVHVSGSHHDVGRQSVWLWKLRSANGESSGRGGGGSHCSGGGTSGKVASDVLDRSSRGRAEHRGDVQGRAVVVLVAQIGGGLRRAAAVAQHVARRSRADHR